MFLSLIYLCGLSCLFRTIMDVQIWLKSVTLTGGLNRHNSIAAEIQTCIAKVCKEDAVKRIQKSPYVGLMLDESLDIAIQKKLVLFFKILVDRKSKIEFAAYVEVKDGKAETIYATVLKYLEESNVPVKKLSGLGTDGLGVLMAWQCDSSEAMVK